MKSVRTSSYASEKQLNGGSPCDKCHSCCTYPDCLVYRRWINRCWGQFRQWPERQRAKPRPENVFRYDPPYFVADYLDRGPCPTCPAVRICGDEERCSAWAQWTEDRNRRLCHRLQRGGDTYAH